VSPFGGVGPFAAAEQDVHHGISIIPPPATTAAETQVAPASSSPATPPGQDFNESTLPLALTVQETSQVLRFDPRTIRAMLRAGDLEGNQRGHAIRISRSSVLDWLRGKRRVPRSKR
jgi:excisionase family DNA binding protein